MLRAGGWLCHYRPGCRGRGTGDGDLQGHVHQGPQEDSCEGQKEQVEPTFPTFFFCFLPYITLMQYVCKEMQYAQLLIDLHSFSLINICSSIDRFLTFLYCVVCVVLSSPFNSSDALNSHKRVPQ